VTPHDEAAEAASEVDGWGSEAETEAQW
jgi:hypothetical protein